MAYSDPDGLHAEPGGAGTRRFRYDPNNPTPSVGGPRMGSSGFGSRPNNKLEARDDVLVFTSEPLAQALEVIGPVSLRLRARGSYLPGGRPPAPAGNGPSFDLFARLCDVDAKDTSWNVCDGLLRMPGEAGRAPAQAEAEAPAQAEVDVPMSATAYRFGAGHRLRVQVSGGAHPRFARNTGTPGQIATATSLVPVDIEVAGAVLSLPVVGASTSAKAGGAS